MAMDFMGTVLNEKYSEMLSSLVSSGFTERQAINFIPTAVSQLFCAGRVCGVDDEDEILEKIDIHAISKELAINELQIISGLSRILPFMNANKKKDDEVSKSIKLEFLQQGNIK